MYNTFYTFNIYILIVFKYLPAINESKLMQKKKYILFFIYL